MPLYDHDRLGECFHAIAYILERLLERILSGRFIRVEFKLEGRRSWSPACATNG